MLFAAWDYIHRNYAPSYSTSIGHTLAFIVPLFSWQEWWGSMGVKGRVIPNPVV